MDAFVHLGMLPGKPLRRATKKEPARVIDVGTALAFAVSILALTAPRRERSNGDPDGDDTQL